MPRGRPKKDTPCLVVATKVKEYAKECGDVNVGADFIEAISDKVAIMTEQAVLRATANKRKTVRAQDA